MAPGALYNSRVEIWKCYLVGMVFVLYVVGCFFAIQRVFRGFDGLVTRYQSTDLRRSRNRAPPARRIASELAPTFFATYLCLSGHG